MELTCHGVDKLCVTEIGLHELDYTLDVPSHEQVVCIQCVHGVIIGDALSMIGRSYAFEIMCHSMTTGHSVTNGHSVTDSFVTVTP